MSQNQNQGQQQQTGQRNWNPVQSSSDNQIWAPQATEKNGFAWDPNNPPVLEGYYTKDRELPSTFKPGETFWVSEVQLLNSDGSLGICVDVTHDTVLTDRMSKIKMGAYIRLVYMGKKLKKGLPNQPWSKTNSYHQWEVFEDANAVNLNDILGKQQKLPPATTNQAAANNTTNNTGQQQQQFSPAQNQQFSPAQNQQFNGGQQQQFQQQPQNQGQQQFQQPAPGQFGQQHPANNQQFGQGQQQQFSQQNTGNGQFQQPTFNQNPAPQTQQPVNTQQFGNQQFTPAPQNPAPAQNQQFNGGQQQPQNQGQQQGNQAQFGGEPVKGNPFDNQDLPF